MEAYRNRVLRGAIMAALKNNNTLGDHLIKILFDNTPYESTLDNIKQQMIYLEDKGYIQLEKVSIKEIGVSRIVARLTSKGQDLIDGTIPPDGGVVIPDE